MIVVKPGSGPYFSQPAFDEVMVPLAKDLLAAGIPVEGDITIMYDPVEDFSHLRFRAGGKSFDIQYYKVLSYRVDGEWKWCGCPLYERWAFVDSIKKGSH